MGRDITLGSLQAKRKLALVVYDTKKRRMLLKHKEMLDVHRNAM
jgi:hypothetical protein